jgi:hypothetical protein
MDEEHGLPVAQRRDVQLTHRARPQPGPGPAAGGVTFPEG